MAISVPSVAPYKPYTNPYLDAAGNPVGGTATPWVGTQAQVDDSVASHVAALTSKDSKMNQMARTEGLKLVNARGLLNSSMGIGAAQDAVIRNALPIAAQDASQAFQKNQLARGFEYGMEDKSRQNAFTSGERLGGEAFTTAERLGTQGFQTSERLGAQGFQTGERLGSQGFQTGERLGSQTFTAGQNLAQQKFLAGESTKQRAFDTVQNQLGRDLQKEIASWNVASSDRNATAQFISNVATQYQAQYNSILSNPNLDAASRTQQFTAAKNLLNVGMNVARNLYEVDFGWNALTSPTTTPAKATATPAVDTAKYGTPYFRDNKWHVSKNGVDMIFNPDVYTRTKKFVPA